MNARKVLQSLVKIFVFFDACTYLGKCERLDDVVVVKDHSNVYFFEVPTSKRPVSSWITVQKGVYPNIAPITKPLNIGEPISLMIYFKDDDRKYDAEVKNCWAYDSAKIQDAKYKIELANKKFYNRKLLSEWKKIRLPFADNLVIFYADLVTFKFPDTDKLYLTCNLQLCYEKCGDKRETT